MRKRRGFSLFEAVCTLFMVFLLLGLCCDLFKQYSTTLNFSAAKANSLTSMQVALQTMLDDARQATSFVSLNPDLEITMVNPKLLNSPVRDTSIAVASDSINVRYHLSNGSLLRDCTPGGGSTTTWKVADSIAGFSVVDRTINVMGPNGGTTMNAVEIRLSLQESVRIRVISGFASRPPF